MNKELLITKEDLVIWLDRPPSNDDLDLIDFITTRLENFYKLEQENKQLKEKLENDIDRYEDTISYQLGFDKGKEESRKEYERLLNIARKMHTWLFLHTGNEKEVYDELGLTDEENALLGYSGQFILGGK